MKIILFLSCLAILSCTDNRPENEATETLPATADSPPGQIVPVDPAIRGDSANAATDSLASPR